MKGLIAWGAALRRAAIEADAVLRAQVVRGDVKPKEFRGIVAARLGAAPDALKPFKGALVAVLESHFEESAAEGPLPLSL